MKVEWIFLGTNVIIILLDGVDIPESNSLFSNNREATSYICRNKVQIMLGIRFLDLARICFMAANVEFGWELEPKLIKNVLNNLE